MTTTSTATPGVVAPFGYVIKIPYRLSMGQRVGVAYRKDGSIRGLVDKVQFGTPSNAIAKNEDGKCVVYAEFDISKGDHIILNRKKFLKVFSGL